MFMGRKADRGEKVGDKSTVREWLIIKYGPKRIEERKEAHAPLVSTKRKGQDRWRERETYRVRKRGGGA